METKKNPYWENLIIGGFIVGVIARGVWIAWLWLKAHPLHSGFLIGLAIFAMIPLIKKSYSILKKKRSDALFEKSILAPDEDSVFCGCTDKDEDVWIKARQRAMHTQVIGTTNAGKTESVILPWAIQDINSGKGLLLIDGKADNSLIDKLWAYTRLAGREDDFRLFSLSRQNESFQFNPLLGGTAEEITERVFNSFEFENPYYRSLQYEVMSQVMRIFEKSSTTPTFQRIHQAISRPKVMSEMIKKVKDTSITRWYMNYLEMSPKDREERTSGLLAAISHFAFGEHSKLFNPVGDAITIDAALKNNQIVYFQLPVLLSPFLGKATGKLVLQSLQAAVANRHRLARGEERKFFSVFLDDFSEYLYEGFVSILNKSRSANVGVVFAHQALGDIKVLGDSVANSIMTNANLKVFMRGNDPESAEYFSKTIGTLTTTKTTERQTKGLLGIKKSGEMSARDVEEFDVHPNVFKKELGVGQAMMIIPHERGSKCIKIKFSKLSDIQAGEMPPHKKSVMPLIEEKEDVKKEQQNKPTEPTPEELSKTA